MFGDLETVPADASERLQLSKLWPLFQPIRAGVIGGRPSPRRWPTTHWRSPR
jgi:hypothetical protein